MPILGEQSVTRLRYVAGTVGADGRLVAGASTSSTVLASVQPVTGRQRQLLPEGLRQRVELIAYCTTELRTVDQVAGVPADRLVVAGETLEVVQVKQWPAAGPLPHYEAALVRLAESGGAP